MKVWWRKERMNDEFIKVTFYIENSGDLFITALLKRRINKKGIKPEKLLGRGKSVFVLYPYISSDDLKELPYFYIEDTKIKIRLHESTRESMEE